MFRENYTAFKKVWKLLLDKGGRALIETVDLHGKRLLTSAIEVGDRELVTALLNLRCDVDMRSRAYVCTCSFGRHRVAGFDAVEQACYSTCSKEDLFRILQLSQNPEIKDRPHAGVALLHCVVLGGSEGLVLPLLDNGANINERISLPCFNTELGFSGATALSLAIWKGENRIVNLLLGRLASKIEVDDGGWTALHYCAYHDNLDAMVTLHQESLPSSARILFPYLNGRPLTSLSPLHLAAIAGHTRIVDHILNAYPKTDIDQRTTYSFTALHLASRYGHTDTVKLLLAKNADQEAVNDMRYTSLHLAATGGHEATALALLESGANVLRWTVDGLDPEMVALKNGHQALADSIRDFKGKMTGNMNFVNLKNTPNNTD